MAETPIQQQILLELTDADTRAWRNNTGALPDPHTGRWVHFGLAPGSADIIGIRTVEITPEMVGQRVGVFVSIEVKRPGQDRTDPERRRAQAAWRDMVTRMGGRAGVARSVTEAKAIADGLV